VKTQTMLRKKKFTGRRKKSVLYIKWKKMRWFRLCFHPLRTYICFVYKII